MTTDDERALLRRCLEKMGLTYTRAGWKDGHGVVVFPNDVVAVSREAKEREA